MATVGSTYYLYSWGTKGSGWNYEPQEIREGLLLEGTLVAKVRKGSWMNIQRNGKQSSFSLLALQSPSGAPYGQSLKVSRWQTRNCSQETQPSHIKLNPEEWVWI